MATSLTPSEFANLVGLEPTDFCEACRNGVSEYAGYPVGDWLVHFGGSPQLNVPDQLVKEHASGRGKGSSSSSRENPGGVDLEPASASRAGQEVTQMAEAVNSNATPVAANASAAYAVGSMSDAVRENPEIFETLTDTAVALGGMALTAYATEDGEEYRAAKVVGGGAGVFAAYKLIRHVCDQGDRRTDMAEREQRHQIQEEKNQGKALPKKRGDGAPVNLSGAWGERQKTR